jgi:hypothetical protein
VLHPNGNDESLVKLSLARQSAHNSAHLAALLTGRIEDCIAGRAPARLALQ